MSQRDRVLRRVLRDALLVVRSGDRRRPAVPVPL